jgi:cell division protein FtsN
MNNTHPETTANLSLSATPAATSNYALQAGQFATDAPAQQLSANIRAQGVASTVLQVSVAGADPWYVVTVGQFNSADMALSQRDYLANKLGLPLHMRVMLLPPPTAK